MPVLKRMSWYANRLRLMSVNEIAYRLQEAVFAQGQRFGFNTATKVPVANLSDLSVNWVGIGEKVDSTNYVKAADRVLRGDLRLFAIENASLGPVPMWNVDVWSGTVAPLRFGKTLDYRNEQLVGNVKYVWELNRHLQLATLAQAYCLTQDKRYLEGIRIQIDSWLAQCPYLQGVNWASSLELSIRLINWSLVWQWIGGLKSPAFEGGEGEEFLRRWLASIYQHGHFIRGHLSRFSSANNHLIGELAGLFVGSLTWPYWSAADQWRAFAKDRLEEEALRQNTADGVNREQAVSYQRFVLDLLIIAGLAARVSGDDFSRDYWRRVEAMLEFIASIMDVRGNVPMIGDSDDGHVARLSQEPAFCPYRALLATGAVLFNRADFKAKSGQLDHQTLWLLGNDATSRFCSIVRDRRRLPVRRAFREGGYYILGCDFETEREIRLIADAGPLGYLSIGAHGHADALAVTLSVGGTEFLVDPGTYTYHSQREWRDYFRSTSAHNTVSVDGNDQSVSGGSFMWMHHPKVSCEQWSPGDEEDIFLGSHDGYTRLDDPVIHRRQITFLKKKRAILIEDTLICRGVHSIDCNWHFAEGCDVAVAQDGSAFARSGEHAIRFVNNGSDVQVIVRRGDTSPIGGWVSRRFGVKSRSTTLVARSRINGTKTLRTKIEVLG